VGGCAAAVSRGFSRRASDLGLTLVLQGLYLLLCLQHWNMNRPNRCLVGNRWLPRTHAQQSRQQSCLNCASPPEVDKGLIRTSLSKCILLKVADSMVYVISTLYFTAPEVGQKCSS